MAKTCRLAIAAMLLPLPARAVDCQYTLVDQSDWFANSGFNLSLFSSPSGTPYCQAVNASISLGVGDGNQFQYVGTTPNWVMNQSYTAQIVISPGSFSLYLDGQLIGQSSSGFAPLPSVDLTGGAPAYVANGVSDYVVAETSLTAQSSSGVSASAPFLGNGRSSPLTMLAPGSVMQSTPFVFLNGDTLTITVVFSLNSIPTNLSTYAPYIDSYGQSVYSTYPTKVQTDSDLQSAAAEEQTMLASWGLATGYDAWGGVVNAGWQDTATGYFHVVKHNSVWWLISPAGNPCFYIGLDTAPGTTGNNTPTTSREFEFAALPSEDVPYDLAWGYNDWSDNGFYSVSFDTWNMIRKYGTSNWQTIATNLTVQRMETWGFSGFGKWSTPTGNLPVVPVLWPNNVPNLVLHPDFFNTQIAGQLQSVLEQQMQGSTNDPAIVGWSFDNEYNEIIQPSEISSILAMNAQVSSKQALVNEALGAIYGNDIAAMAAAWGVSAANVTDLYNAVPNPPATDIETLREYYADQYYGFLYKTIKGIDPNHLYFGFWIVPGLWVNQTDWQLNAAHLDVIGYDRYNPVFEDSQLQSLAQSTNMPIFLGEFSFPPHYDLARGYEVYPSAYATDDQDAGAEYAANLAAAARNPWCVGVNWFEYRDEPVAGRGYDGETDLDLVEGEDYAFGMVDVTDNPKYDLVTQVRATNLAMAQRRLQFAPPSLNTGGVVNNASFAANTPVAPGSIISIFGSNLSDGSQTAASVPLPTVLGGASLTLGGVAVPIIHAFPLQIDAQVPWELAQQGQAQLTMVNDDLYGNAITVPLAPFSPGIYTAAGNGSGQGAIVINGTNLLAAPGNPAHRGTDYIDIYATGLGPVNNQPATGSPAPASPLAYTTNTVTVTFGAVPVTAAFAGLAPGFVGLYQVNVEVPSDAPVGNAVPLILEVGGVTSNQVTIAVQ